MTDPTIDVKFSISPDSKNIIIEDDTTGWGDVAKTNVTAVSLKFYTDLAHTDEVAEVTTLLPVTSKEIDFTSTTDEVSLAFIAEYGTYLPDGVYYYTLSYTQDAGGDSTSPLTKDDGVFYNTRVVEGNINSDLLDFLTGVQAYNYKMEYPKLEEIRRRDNILFAIESAEFLSEIDNVENLLSLLQRLE